MLKLEQLLHYTEAMWNKFKENFISKEEGKSLVAYTKDEDVNNYTNSINSYLHKEDSIVYPFTKVANITDENGRKLGDIMGENEIQFVTTIKASDWQGEQAPYTNTITSDEIKSNDTIDLTTPTTITNEQVSAYQVARIVNATQADGTITLYCWGIKPDIDLPVLVNIRGTAIKTSETFNEEEINNIVDNLS